MDEMDIKKNLDLKNSKHVQWLMNQMKTYDCTKQIIIGLVFDDSTIISDVFWMKRANDATS